MKRLMPLQYAKILCELTARLESEKDIAVAVRAFAERLRKDHALGQASAVMKAFAEYADEREGRMSIFVTAARPMESGAKKILQERLGALIKDETIDGTIIGGVVVKTKNMLLDGSVQGQLRRLREQLAS